MTGPQDVFQDYGPLVFLVAVVLVGIGVVAMILRVPPAADDPDEANASQ